MKGPAGGTWVLAEGSNPWRCEVCGAFVKRIWRYFVGGTSHACVCERCAEK